MNDRSAERGFTISELVVVLVVFGALIAIAVTSINAIDDEAAKRDCKTELRALKAASERFKAELSIYPEDDLKLQDAGYLDLDETPHWKVVTVDLEAAPTYVPVGSRCA